MRSKGVRLLASSPCVVSKTVTGQRQQPSSRVGQFRGAVPWPRGLLSDLSLQGEGCCKDKHQRGAVFSIESKEKRCEAQLLQS